MIVFTLSLSECPCHHHSYPCLVIYFKSITASDICRTFEEVLVQCERAIELKILCGYSLGTQWVMAQTSWIALPNSMDKE